MSADLHIHVMTDEITEDVLRNYFSNTLGSKWFAGFGNLRTSMDTRWEKALEIVHDAPHVYIGEVSWLKAGLFDDEETYVPGPVQAVHGLIDDAVTVIDDAFIEAVRKAMNVENRTDYDIAEPDKVVEFLEQHRGKRVFTVSH